MCNAIMDVVYAIISMPSIETTQQIYVKFLQSVLGFSAIHYIFSTQSLHYTLSFGRCV